MTIDTDALAALGDNWMIRTDNDGGGYRGFRWAPVGEWTECPRWSDETTADCESGGLFGQGPGGYGYAQAGARFVFCETGPERMAVEGNKVKVRRARILYVGADAFDALFFVTGGIFPGSLDLRGCTLPKGLALPQTVGDWLDLSDCTLPEGLALPQTVGGWLNLRDCTLPDGLALPQTVGGRIYR